MDNKRFWSPRTTAVLVLFFTICSLFANGIVNTAALYVVGLGMVFSYRIIARY